MKEKSIKNYIIGDLHGFHLSKDGAVLCFPTMGEAMKTCIEFNKTIEDEEKLCRVIPLWKIK